MSLFDQFLSCLVVTELHSFQKAEHRNTLYIMYKALVAIQDKFLGMETQHEAVLTQNASCVRVRSITWEL